MLPGHVEVHHAEVVQWTLDGSITFFIQLLELFRAHFISNKREQKSSIHLTKIWQARREDLKEYMTRFNHEAVLIPYLQDAMCYMTFLNGCDESKVTTFAET